MSLLRRLSIVALAAAGLIAGSERAPAFVIPPPPMDCGNMILDMGEECDDGNNIDGDGCTAFCFKELDGGVVPVFDAGLADTGPPDRDAGAVMRDAGMRDVGVIDDARTDEDAAGGEDASSPADTGLGADAGSPGDAGLALDAGMMPPLDAAAGEDASIREDGSAPAGDASSADSDQRTGEDVLEAESCGCTAASRAPSTGGGAVLLILIALARLRKLSPARRR